MIYYKYRPLTGDGFKRFTQILVDKKIHAAKFTNLNDVMEGVFYFQSSGISKDVLKRLKDQKMSYNICSFSKAKNQPLMWAHYADGSCGVNLGVKICHNEVHEVNYDELPFIADTNTYVINGNEFREGEITGEELLLTKLPYWAYEEEVRVLTRAQFIDVEIKEVILGLKMEQHDKDFLHSLITSIDPTIHIS